MNRNMTQLMMGIVRFIYARRRFQLSIPSLNQIIALSPKSGKLRLVVDSLKISIREAEFRTG